MWIKRGSGLGVEQMVCECYSGSSVKDEIWLQSNNSLNFVKTDGGGLATTTAPIYRDVAAWYHFLIAADTTQGSNADRVKIYKNGVQQTLSQQDTIVQDSNFQFGASGAELTFGVKNDLSWYFDGSMANVEMVDGQQLDPTYFGSTNTATGIWTPEASSTISDYGTNGFKLKMDTTSPGADTSGKGNTFTASGTPTLTQGSPSNVYANFNILKLETSSPPSFLNGNTYIDAMNDNASVTSTIGGQFKWYYEYKINQNSDTGNGYGCAVGACHEDTLPTASWNDGNYNNFENSKVKWYSNSAATGRFMEGSGNQVISSLTKAVANQIIGVACDAANGRVYISINGVYQNSGNPVSGTGFIAGTTGTGGTWLPFIGSDGSKGTGYANFGEGFFGTTAAGTNADDNGQGLFAYDVPAGYYALNTKNLEAYG